ncbi:MAG TPA: C2 family cysteine protease [Mycobacterium sp.]|uniref:C2 family cysteine protease n=1 Tax=Mycobacterium sp. TaxID=1785 RepID=UPI002CB7E0FF|nr:C2 family cysteine protease [Mycobacterium sp.]HME79734.1 C2 family cysteine protease [Mycobacterium sp.]
MTATAVPTLSELLSWDTEHLTEGADYWERTANRWDSAFAEAEQQIRASRWEGEAFGAATERAYADKVRVGNVADDLREGARTARQGASDVSAARSRLQYIVEAAQDAGFDVYDDYTVASRQTAGTAAEQAALQAQAESFADEIYGGAAQLVARDQQVGAGIATAVGHVGNLTFDEQGPGGPLPEDSGGDPKWHRWTDKDLYPHDPTAADVDQKTIGDCYLDATMGAIANANPQWIKDRIHYDDATGNFDVTLWDGHEWKHIAVTQDDIDTDLAHNGASWLDNGQPNAALWPSVLESAYAKAKYPNQSLGDALSNSTGIGQGGYAQDAMEALTGNRGTNINPQNVWLTNQHIDQSIACALANHQPVTVSTTPNGAPLEKSHVYVVESITGTGSDAQVTLRNPWETNVDTPVNTPGPLVTVRLGDLIGSGLPTGDLPGGPLGNHPMSNVNIGSLG